MNIDYVVACASAVTTFKLLITSSVSEFFQIIIATLLKFGLDTDAFQCIRFTYFGKQAATADFKWSEYSFIL
jgi:hypothetical protein